ncbi:biotin carboxyl carrier protein of acetyl-CoA carboxylase, chloroplastic-like isoform X1 [Phoenix dactylifera]|uniref:Biotin carboxyl carrier protein of acetyl-CoA carboxylase n=1 Tax=Phoenix dactylifera TaxID=42345 RepID=A0A8B7CRT9_PHODC|nr:biotin carboxyl carrier protein of acetyl-CoA carboxylase, chloroplastic-like isoform X1 [Phoenix dactylifera]
MASISVPCPKCSVVAPHAAWRQNPQQSLIPMVSPSKPGSPMVARSARFPLLKGSNRCHSLILKAQVQEVGVDGSSSSSARTSTKSGNLSSKDKEADALKESASQTAAPDSMISAYIAEASKLVKLVDSKDITELQLKRKDFELIIRKKEALPQPSPIAPPVMMQSAQAVLPPHSPVSYATPPPTTASPSPAAPAPSLPPVTKGGSNLSLPPLKCPMAGTFYRCPGPGEPPFVKVGDKVQKGQVVCIIEAMKLMNEIEADQSGTVVEILAEDGKPVSIDTPLLIIQP